MKLPKKIKTLRQAIKQSILMWYWLFKNPQKNKLDYFIYCGYNCFDFWNADCALCEYFYELGKLNSKKCERGQITCPLATKKLCGYNFPGSAFAKWFTNIDLDEDDIDILLSRKSSGKILVALIERWKKNEYSDRIVDSIIYKFEENK